MSHMKAVNTYNHISDRKTFKNIDLNENYFYKNNLFINLFLLYSTTHVPGFQWPGKYNFGHIKTEILHLLPTFKPQ